MIDKGVFIIEKVESNEKFIIIPYLTNPLKVIKVAGKVQRFSNGFTEIVDEQKEIISKDILILQRSSEVELSVGNLYYIKIENRQDVIEKLNFMFLSIQDVIENYLINGKNAYLE
ncbi:MAG: hypothetical protein N2746_10055 [Deltaproteobacteria bacterium]|nr:hypothetical protein [Deltaproteobacteria bacterium]